MDGVVVHGAFVEPPFRSRPLSSIPRASAPCSRFCAMPATVADYAYLFPPFSHCIPAWLRRVKWCAAGRAFHRVSVDIPPHIRFAGSIAPALSDCFLTTARKVSEISKGRNNPRLHSIFFPQCPFSYAMVRQWNDIHKTKSRMRLSAPSTSLNNCTTGQPLWGH